MYNMSNVGIQVIYIPCSWQTSYFQFSSLIMMWHWFSGHVSFTLPENFSMRMAAVSAKQPGMGNCTGRADNTKENIKQEYMLIQEYCTPIICPNSFTRSVKSGQEPSRARLWSYCQTSPNPPLQLCLRHCQPSQRNIPSYNCLPGCFSPSSLPGCPSPGAWLLLLPSAGRPLVRRPGARCHQLGAGYQQEPSQGCRAAVVGHQACDSPAGHSAAVT